MSDHTISRRQFIKKTALGAGGLVAGSIGAQTLFTNPALTVKKGSKPNILFIAVDDLRIQLGCYGHTQTLSPRIDQLAADGILFERAYCQVPVCGASRASILTGIRPDHSRGRFTAAGSRADQDAPQATTLPAHFKAHGYHTLGNGKIYHFVADSANGWSETPWRPYDYDTDGNGDWAAYNFDKLWLDPASKQYVGSNGRGPYFECPDVPDDAYEDGKIAMKTIQDLRRLRAMDKPFFLACGFSRPHLPFNAPKKYYDRYDPEAIDLADNRYAPLNKPSGCTNSTEIKQYTKIEGWPNQDAFHRQARHAYYACVTYVDTMIGRILDELKSLGLDQNTIVVLWGDHGWHLGEHNFWGKHNTLNNALQVPLLIRAPGFRGPLRTHSLVEFVDVYPTLCALTGLPGPDSHTLAGESLVPLMQNPLQSGKPAAYSEWGTGRAVKTDRYLYTEWSNGSKMLYDHQIDPDENNNVAGQPENSSVVAELSSLLQNLIL